VVLDGGESQIGLESTIVSFDGEQVRLLRPASSPIRSSRKWWAT
jgi:tRNA A37 threonylcarbamoyladenosine synthetase subunit TsaC/SUA5/YrdC